MMAEERSAKLGMVASLVDKLFEDAGFFLVVWTDGQMSTLSNMPHDETGRMLRDAVLPEVLSPDGWEDIRTEGSA